MAAALMAGIAVDHWFPVDLRWWLGLSIVGLALWWGFEKRNRPYWSAVCLLLAFTAFGAGRYHYSWSVYDGTDIGCFAQESPQLVRVVTKIETVPQTIVPRADSWNGGPVGKPRAVCNVDCRQIAIGSGEFTTLTGKARLHAGGYLPELEPGDEIEFTAQLQRPSGPQFAGDFDFARHLRGSGIRAILICSEPSAILVRTRAPNSLFLVQQRLRAHCEQVLAESLSSENAPLGVAILLGTRTGLSEELRRDFAESGTTHILAISGVNVAILATLLWVIIRVCFRVGHGLTIWLVVAGVLLYAFVADNNPPVFRAVVMSLVFLIGMIRFRNSSPINSLSAAAIIVLLYNPTYLFDVGAQLSFLAVLGLVSSNLWLQSRSEPEAQAEEALDALSRTWWQQGLWKLGRGVRDVLAATFAVWLFTLPLMLARFQIFSPVGFVVNVLLSPLSMVMLWMGYLCLVLGSIWQPLGMPFAWMFDGALYLLVKIVSWSARTPWGHFYVPGPPEWWLAGFYILLLAAVTASAFAAARWRRIGWRTLVIWTLLGLALPLFSRRERQLTCQFLPVGHGVAVLIQLPNGRNLLYDAGQMQNASRAERAVQQTVWRTDRPRIDALILSHADADHFNALPGLLRSVPVDRVLMHRTFLDMNQPLVKRACEELDSRQVPVRLIEEGDRLRLDDEVELIVRQPAWDGFRGSDNANSVVLEIVYAGRRILLTGDLEGIGLQNLLKQPKSEQGFDVMLSPHHGGRVANTKALANWAQPRCVVVSGGRQDGVDRLRQVYGRETELLSTFSSGTIRYQVHQDGTTKLTKYRSPE